MIIRARVRANAKNARAAFLSSDLRTGGGYEGNCEAGVSVRVGIFKVSERER